MKTGLADHLTDPPGPYNISFPQLRDFRPVFIALSTVPVYRTVPASFLFSARYPVTIRYNHLKGAAQDAVHNSSARCHMPCRKPRLNPQNRMTDQM